jgi:hypothetical protein
MAEKKVLFTVNGFSVKEDSSYVVKDKKDMDAPSGYIQAGVSKLPSRGVGDSFEVSFISTDGGRTGVYDTGFFEYSNCYRELSMEERKPIVAALKKNLLNPYRLAKGNPTAFENGKEGEAFIQSQRFMVRSNKTYNTSDIESAMELYFGLLTRQLTPKGEEGNTAYEDSSYVVIDLSKDRNIKDERALNEFKAIGAFSSMLRADKERLYAILKYVGMTFLPSIDEGAIISMFNDYIRNNNSDKTDIFNSLVTETETKAGLDKVFIYKALKDLSVRATALTKSSGIYYYNDVEVGSDLKNAADNINKNPKLVQIKKELLLAEDED